MQSTGREKSKLRVVVNAYILILQTPLIKLVGMTYHRLSDLQLMYMPLDAQELDPNGLISDKLSMQYAQRRSDEEV